MIPRRIRRGMKLRPHRPNLALDIMPGRHTIGVKLARGLQQILELHPLIAADTRHRRRAGKIGVSEFLDHRLAEGILIIQHIVRKAHGFRHPPRVMNIAPRTTCALFGQRRPMIIKLQGDAHHVIAFLGQLRRNDRAVNAPRHRHHHPCLGRRLGKAQGIQRMIKGHGGPVWGKSQKPAFETQYRKIRHTLNPCVSQLLKAVGSPCVEGMKGCVMYLKRVDGPRQVTLPDGTVLSRADLPPPATRRWVASRKAIVVKAVIYGLIPQSEAMERYALSEEEFALWRAAVEVYGENALKVTAIQKYRQL